MHGRCSARLVFARSALVLLALAGSASAQHIVDGPNIVPHVMGAHNNINNGAAPFNGTTQVSNAALIVRGRGRVTDDGTARDFTITGARLAWTLPLVNDEVARADLHVPLLSDFRIRFNTPGMLGVNLTNLHLTAKLQLFREDTAGAGDWNATPVGNVTIHRPYGPLSATADDTFRFTDLTVFSNLPTGARRYDLRVEYELYGSTEVAGPFEGDVGTWGELDMHTLGANAASFGDTLGSAWSWAVTPHNYNGNSRALVHAPQARTNFGVTGAGVGGNRIAVAVLEPNQSYLNHQSLNGRISALAGANNSANFTGEHALAVASIIGSSGANNAASTGIAPGARIITASAADYGAGAAAGSTLAAAQALVGPGGFGAGNAGIINFSQAGETAFTVYVLDQFLNQNTNVTWVSAAGNYQITPGASLPGFTYAGRTPNPNYAYNNIAVGALDGTFTKPAIFSSETGGTNAGGIAGGAGFPAPTVNPSKPEIMAPGEYVLSAASRDLTNTGAAPAQFTRVFLGDDWKYDDRVQGSLAPVNTFGATTGPINGTSFAAPHVSGAVALLHDYAVNHAADFDARARDQRVMKAVILAGAFTNGLTDRSAAPVAWNQGKTGNGLPGTPYNITRSLDTHLGAGALDIDRSLQIYAGGEALGSDANASQIFQINGSGGSPLLSGPNPPKGLWDLERVAGAQAGPVVPGQTLHNGIVDYVLGSTVTFDFIAETGNWVGRVAPNFAMLRAVLAWNRTTNAGATAYNALANLELRLFVDGLNIGNAVGYDPNNPNADILLAQTSNNTENVKLLEYFDPQNLSLSAILGPVLPAIWEPRFYLQVVNLSDGGFIDYGIAMSFIPAPGAAVLFGLMGVVAARRRRA